MIQKIKNFIFPGRKFKKEVQRQIRMLITITFGFTIAFTWRQTIFDISESLIQSFFNVDNSSTLSLMASIFITLISIFIIYLSAYYLKEDDGH